MYIIKKLKNLFPHYAKDLDMFDIFLRKCSNDVEKIYDTNKDNFHWLVQAYLYGPGNPLYTKCMARYETSINFDRDFLTDCININTANMSIDDMRKYIIGNYYDIKYDNKMRERAKVNGEVLKY